MISVSQTLTVTTDGSGNGSATSKNFNGLLVEITYVKPGSGGYDNGVDFDVTRNSDSLKLWDEDNVNASKQCLPRMATHSLLGVAAVTGSDAVLDLVPLNDETITVSVANGGSAKTGSFIIRALGQRSP